MQIASQNVSICNFGQLLATFLCSPLGDVENSRFNYVQSHPVCYSSVLVHSCLANLDMTKIIHREIKSAFACNMFSAAAVEQKCDSSRQRKWLLQTAQYLRRIRSNTQDLEVIPGEIITVLTEIKYNLFWLIFSEHEISVTVAVCLFSVTFFDLLCFLIQILYVIMTFMPTYKIKSLLFWGVLHSSTIRLLINPE